MPKYLTIFTVAIMFAASSLARAQDLAPVAPFLDDRAIVVVDIDVKRIDLTAFEASTVRAMEAAKVEPADVKRTRDEMRADLRLGQGWLDALKRAKADRAFVVISMPQANASGPPIFAVVPTADDAAATAVGKTIDEATASGKVGGNVAHDRIGNAIVVGEPAMLAALDALKPVDRADLAAAHATAMKAGNGAVHVAFAPTGPLRAMMTMLPDAVTSVALTNGIQSIGLSVGLPPAESLDIIIRSKDAKSAAALEGVIAKFWQARQAQGAPVALTKLQPKAAGDGLTLSLDGAGVTKLVDGIVPSLTRARATAVTVQSASNIRQLLMMCLMYSNANAGKMPESLDALRTGKFTTPEQFDKLVTNPARPDAKPGYVYVKPKEAKMSGIADAPTRPLIYEAFDGQFPAGGVNVGFVDGHVEKVKDEARFNALIELAN